MPAVYANSQATESISAHATSVIRDDDATLSRKRAARETLAVTPAALIPSKQLAPAPRAHTSAYALLTAFFTIPTVLLWVGYGFSHSTHGSTTAIDPTGQGFGGNDFGTTGFGDTGLGDPSLSPAVGHNSTLSHFAIAFMSVAAALLVVTLLSTARRMRIKRRRPAAEAVWRRGWYCGRCATVYFRAGEAPTGIEPVTAIAPPDFQHAVWAAGGYARRRPGGVA